MAELSRRGITELHQRLVQGPPRLPPWDKVLVQDQRGWGIRGSRDSSGLLRAGGYSSLYGMLKERVPLKKSFKGKMGLPKTKGNFCEGERQKAEDLQEKSGGLDIQTGTGCFPKEGLAREGGKHASCVVRGHTLSGLPSLSSPALDFG